MVQIRENISLRPFNTFGIDACARRFASFSSVDELKWLLQQRDDDPLLILGGGSNILLRKNFEGLVLKNEITGKEVVKEDADCVFLRAGAGENWHQLVMHCVDNNLGGPENLSLIPGNVGASPMQNIGAYGVEIQDVFEELEAWHLHDKEIHRFKKEDCAFGYRESVFKNKYRGQYVILNVTYRLHKHPEFNTSYGAIQQELEAMGVEELSVQAVSQAVINIRSSKLPDPKEVGNAGSFFKNPAIPKQQFDTLKQAFPDVPSFPFDAERVKVPAGWLIEQCGWKGQRIGDAGCYPKQALVLVNWGNASGDQVFELSEEILQSVYKKFGIALEREVNVIG